MTFFKKNTRLRAGLKTNRIEAFSDGVFAIAITILVLTISIPNLSKQQVAQGQLLPTLIALWPKILSYIISFAIVGIFWIGHHIMFHYVKKTDRRLLWLNNIFLMIVSFIPVPAAILGLYPKNQVAIIAYGATLIAAGLVFYSMWRHAVTDFRLTHDHLDTKLAHKAGQLILFGPLMYFVAIFTSFWSPYLSLFLYFIVPLFYILPGPIDQLVDFAEDEND